MKFNIKNIEVDIHLGTTREERAKKQMIKINLSFEIDSQKAAKSDNIEDTIDYFSIYQFIKSFPGEKPFHLVERLHQSLSKRLHQTFPELQNTKIRIEKFPFPDASVTIEL